jgi:hypothetical protein
MSDLTTLGVKVGYAVEATAGTQPTTGYTQIPRCLSIGGVKLTPATIDVSTLEDLTKQYADGQQDTGGTWENVYHSGALTAIQTMMTAAATAKAAGKGVWWVIFIEGLSKSYFLKAQPGTNQGLSDISIGKALEIPVTCIINDVLGFDTAVEPTVGA